jgi:hypothetical protein
MDKKHNIGSGKGHTAQPKAGPLKKNADPTAMPLQGTCRGPAQWVVVVRAQCQRLHWDIQSGQAAAAPTLKAGMLSNRAKKKKKQPRGFSIKVDS